jgi:hypothetical protein
MRHFDSGPMDPSCAAKNRGMPPNDAGSDPLTWAVLLAQCTEFARSAVALPEDGEAGRHRRSVPHLITLAAITHALGQLDRLDEGEHALALDRSEIQIRDAIAALDMIWEGRDPPEAVWVFVEEAAAALGEAMGIDPDDETDDGVDRVAWFAASDGVSWGHPADLLGALATLSPTLEAWVPSPGVPFFDGAVVFHLQDEAGVPDEAVALVDAFLGKGVEGPAEVGERFQVFRQFDFLKGGPVRDVLAPEALHEAVPGQPLLIPGVVACPGEAAGEIAPVPMPARKSAPIPTLQVFEAVPEDEDEDGDAWDDDA